MAVAYKARAIAEAHALSYNLKEEGPTEKNLTDLNNDLGLE